MSYITNPHMLPKVRSDDLKEFARGEQCALRLPGICNHNPETTVLCHLPGIGKGTGTKVSDIHAANGCSACHDAMDRFKYEKFGLTDAMVLDAQLRGLAETQARWVMRGKLIVPKADII